jgi:hypothetical protein
MKTNRKLYSASMMCIFLWLTLALAGTALGKDHQGSDNQRDHDGHEPAKTLYVWAGDQARVAPDFLAVIRRPPARSVAHALVIPALLAQNSQRP